MKTDKIEVAKIDIKIGDKTISLKPEQAKELKKILNDMFEESTDKTVHHYWWHQPFYLNPYPAINPYPQWQITCGSIGAETIGNDATYANNVTLSLNAA